MQPMGPIPTIQPISTAGTDVCKALSGGSDPAAARWEQMLACPGSKWTMWGAWDQGVLQAVALVLFQPGRTGLLLTSPGWSLWPVAEGASLIRATVDEALDQGLLLIQSFQEPEAREEIEILSLADFQPLGPIVYMQRDLAVAGADPELPAGFEWVRWEDLERPEVLSELILRTYEGSLDCPEITGLLSGDQILSIHRQAGRFRPESWYVLVWRGQATGCLLVNDSLQPGTLELVYMAVLPSWRGKGLGRLLISKALSQGLGESWQRLRLAVDARNHPARKLYEAAGFEELFRRMALVKYAR